MTYLPTDYVPLFKGGHRMTLYAWGRPRNFPQLPTPIPRYFSVETNSQVLAHCHWQKHPSEQPTLILLHGLEGSSHAHYMPGIAEKAWIQGWNVVRLNQRNCGGTEHLSPGLYHSGLTHDPLFVLRELIEIDRLPSLTIAGYSLGGNLALKLAGDLGESAPAELKTVCAVSPTMNLASCIEALERGENFIYQWNFVRRLKNRMRRKAKIFPALYDLRQLRSVRTIRQFDEAYTAPHHGFLGASDYYQRASALRVINKIGIPTLILTAADDPVVPVSPFQNPALTKNSFLNVIVTPHGGHCAFIEKSSSGYDGYWAEREIIRFSDQKMNQ